MPLTNQPAHPLAIVVGTDVQRRIAEKLQPRLSGSRYGDPPAIVSLADYYRFGLRGDELRNVITVPNRLARPWYGWRPWQKPVPLAMFLADFLVLTRRYEGFLFLVDTGVLERSAIRMLRFLRRRTIVLQDALKRKPRDARPGSLRWFGGGGADLYLLMGERFRDMVMGGRVAIVGSPLYSTQPVARSEGNKILVVNQCFARYRETSLEVEVEFVREVVQVARAFGDVEVRLHPHNDPQAYEFLVEDGIEVTRDRELTSSLAEAGIVLAINSTVAMEALAAGSVVVLLTWHPSPYDCPVRRGAISCRDLEELAELLQTWSRGELGASASPAEVASELTALIGFEGDASLDRIAEELDRFFG